MSQLALHGGTPIRSMPFPSRGHVGAEEKAAVDALFDRAIATGDAPGYNGEQETAYCEAFSAWMGGGYTDAVSSGTAGIYVALRALDLEPFTEVIVAAVTDPGGMMPIPLLNLIPIVADTAPNSYNTGPEQVAALLSPRTRAIVVPHIGGEPADIAGIVELAQAHDIPVIEDCSQSHGATLDGKPVGTFGDIAVFSTMFGKHHSTGGQGGVVFSRDEALYHRIRRASDRGKPFFLPDDGRSAPSTGNLFASLNLNSSDLAATIGLVQLRKLPEMVARRRRLVESLARGLEEMPWLSIPEPLPGAVPSHWFLRMRFHAERCTADKATFCKALSAESLPVMASYAAAMPHTMDWFLSRRVFGSSGYPWTSAAYQGDPDRDFPCPNAQATMATHFNLMLHEAWGPQEIADAAAIIEKVGRAFDRPAG